MQQHREKSKTFQKIFEWVKLAKTLVFMRKVSHGHIICDNSGLGCAASCREYTSLRDDKESKPKGLVRGNTKNGPALQVKVANYLQRYGIEVKTDSMQNDGIQSWIVISRGTDKYVTELPEKNEKPSHYEEVALGAGKPIATTTETIHTIFIFIFVDDHADQSTEMERHIRSWKN